MDRALLEIMARKIVIRGNLLMNKSNSIHSRQDGSNNDHALKEVADALKTLDNAIASLDRPN